MKTMIKLSFVMAAYAVVACVGLAGVYLLTAPRIEAAAREEANAGFRAVFADADEFVDVSAELASPSSAVSFDRAVVAKKSGAAIGLCVQATGATYKSSTILVGVDMSRKLLPLVFMANTDTPGLGTKTAEPEFAGQFSGKSLDDGFAVGKDIAAISGATISSRGVTAMVRLASYAAGEYLAKNFGAAAGSAPAPVVVDLAPMPVETALAELFPESEYAPVEGFANALERSIVFDGAWLARKDGKVVGIAVLARGQTYHASTALVGVRLDGTLAGLRITATTDSKNYGYHMLDPAFYGTFTGKPVADGFLAKPATAAGDVDSISGATISTMGIANIAKVASLSGAAYLAESHGGKKPPAGELILNVIPLEE
jgi:electron transport complex protein RnfG